MIGGVVEYENGNSASIIIFHSDLMYRERNDEKKRGLDLGNSGRDPDAFLECYRDYRVFRSELRRFW